VPLSGCSPVLGILALPLMILAVKMTFDADWVMAFVVGVLGGFAVFCCAAIAVLVLLQVFALSL
jgi:hypothetical protein